MSAEDTRSLTDLAAEALVIQRASDLADLIHRWSRSLIRLRRILWDAPPEAYHAHPVNVLFAAKVTSLAGSLNTGLVGAPRDAAASAGTGLVIGPGPSAFSAAYHWAVRVCSQQPVEGP